MSDEQARARRSRAAHQLLARQTELAPARAPTHASSVAPPTSAAADAGPILGLQRGAGNQAVSAMLTHRAPRRASDGPARAPAASEQDLEREADLAADAIVERWQSGYGDPRDDDDGAPSDAPDGARLPSALRRAAQPVIGDSADDVRLHTGDEARAATSAHDALAIALGRDIHLAPHQFAPETRAGRHLLAHELAHTAQQASLGASFVQRQKAGGKTATKRKQKTKTKTVNVRRMVFWVDLNVVLFYNEHGDALQLPVDYNGKPNPGSYLVTVTATNERVPGRPTGGVSNDKGWVFQWTAPPGYKLVYAKSYSLDVRAGRPGGGGSSKDTGAISAAEDEGSGMQEGAGKKKKGEGEGAGGGQKKGDKQSEGGGGGGKGSGKGAGEGDAAGVAGGTGATANGVVDPDARRLTPSEETLWRELYEKMTGQPPSKLEDPVELVRLYGLLRSKVEDPKFTTKGEPWTNFARFLEKNRDKIDGVIKSAPGGKLTVEKLEEIVRQYGKFVAGEPGEDERGELKTAADYDKEFEYDPGWAMLSKADRKLLVGYARLSPDQVGKKKVEFPRLTRSHKMVMALKLSWKSWPGEIADAAKEAFTDATFVITLIVMLAIYVALWLTPDPSFITKIAAGTLTLVLLSQFAYEDLYGLVVAFSEMGDACELATDIEGIQAAGDRFAKKVGKVGFDIILFLVTWRIGKRLGPKVRAGATERLVTSAKEGVSKAEAKPGSGVAQAATPEGKAMLGEAKVNAKANTPTAILDALANLLPEKARTALAKFRAKAGDASALKALEGQQGRGSDIARFLEEQSMTKEAKAAAKADVLDAEARLARAELLRAETLKDPALRKAARKQAIANLIDRLTLRGVFEDPAVREAAKSGDLARIAGALGEALQRAELAKDFPAAQGYRVIANLAIARVVPGFKTIAEWKAAEAKAGRPDAKTAKLVEHDGKLWELQGEADSVVVEPSPTKGKVRPVAIEEVKTGSADSLTDALAQIAKAIAALKLIEAGDPNVRAFENSGEQKFGNDVTATLDLSGIDSVGRQTRGPAGKGHTNAFPYNADVLRAVAESIIENGLPPKGAKTVIPPTSPEREEKQEPAGAAR